MKIIQAFKIYWPDNGGGIAKVMESIADAFADCRQEIIVCQNDRHKKSVDDMYKGIPVHRCRQLFTCVSTPVSIEFLRKIKQDTTNSDLLIYHFPYPMADLAVLLGLPAGRLVVWWHCGFEKYAWLAPLYRPFAWHTLKKADLILVSAKGNVKNSRLLRQFEKKCRVIPFCVSDTYLQKGSAYAAGIEKAQESGESQKKTIRILFIGRLVWYKGCDVLLKAFQSMKQKNCRLILIGSGVLEMELRQLAASLGLTHVEFMGRVSEKEKMRQIEMCDFLVLPSVSKAEAFAVVQIEAMAFGKPVINTALPSGVPDVSIDGVTGITVKPKSVRGLARAMDTLAEDEGLRRMYGSNALQRVQEKYTQQKMGERYREIFEKKVKETYKGLCWKE